MKVFIILALCGVAASKSKSVMMTPLEFGMTMGDTAYKAVCWYENLKIFPKTNADGFLDCMMGADSIIKSVMEPVEQNKKYFEAYPEKKETWFGERMTKRMMGKIPSAYSSKCNQYLADPKAAPPADESDAVNDSGNEYPYRAFAYCMMQTLRSEHGDKAVEAVKNERTKANKNWRQALLDRENEFRARHGAEPLKLNPDLNEAAQSWADFSSKRCDSQHTKSEERKYKGEQTGESLFAGGGPDENDISAYQAADGWYEENRDYPFAVGYTGKENPDIFHKIGHFTQSVWKGTKQVGYGYAYNEDCGSLTKYIVARYYPAGNMVGEFTDNVGPPKDD